MSQTGWRSPADELAHLAQLKDIFRYRVASATQDVPGGPWRLCLHDSGGIAAVTLPADRVTLLADDQALVTRATVLAYGLGLPEEIRKSGRT